MRVLRELMKNSRQSGRAIAEKLTVSQSTVTVKQRRISHFLHNFISNQHILGIGSPMGVEIILFPPTTVCIAT